MTCEIKHYPTEEKPYGMWVNGEFVGSYNTVGEAVAVYEKMAGFNRERNKAACTGIS